jgi:hypothetical protein
MEKLKQKLVKKINSSPVEKLGEHIYIDISSKEPDTFNEAWFYDNPEEKNGLRDAIEKE